VRLTTLSYVTEEHYNLDEGTDYFWIVLMFGDYEVVRWETDYSMNKTYTDEDRDQFVADKLGELFK